MKKLLYKTILFTLVSVLSFGFISCSKDSAKNTVSIGVFVPGIVADSPTYANLVEGVKEGVDLYNASLAEGGKKAVCQVLEAGTNQSEWGPKITALCASGSYEVIISSNEALPELVAPITAKFPKLKFILIHGFYEGNPQMYCVNYDQREQVYVSGYLSGLMSKSHKVAVVAAQEYPAMNNILYPYYARGAADAVNGTTCDFRIVGNWYDASKGAEITDALCASGVDIILPICGGASRGVISSAKEHGAHLSFIDADAFVKAPGTIISSCATKQAQACKEAVLQYLKGETPWGTTRSVGMRDGYIEFVQDSQYYVEAVPESVRTKVASLVTSLCDGSLSVPEL